MMKFDHLSIPVIDVTRSRDLYVGFLGLKVEFEMRDRRTVALRESDGVTIFLQEASASAQPEGCGLWFRGPHVEADIAALSARGIAFNHGPRTSFWGYGVELADPDGYLIRRWDVVSMREK